jgi:hypothetical protein
MWSWPQLSFLSGNTDVRADVGVLDDVRDLTTRRLAGTVVVAANSQHLYQVISGFLMLQRAGVVDVTLRYQPDHRASLPTSHIVELQLTDGTRIAYDMIDGYNFVGPARFEDYLATVDCYFKRSFDPGAHAAIPHASRIVPFGLNYPVTVKHRFFAHFGSPGVRGLPERAARMVLGPRSLDVARFEDVPHACTDAHVIFQTRTWDPAEIENEEQQVEREHMNALRVACVRRLRREFGPRFQGGLMPTPHARANFPDCVLTPDLASKRRYMRALKTADICVASAGLYGSNGWSLGEYTAASKAIVSQHLKYTVPAFMDGRNYLGFATADECVQGVAALVDDPQRLQAMKVENYAYYHRYLRPDRLVLNTLLMAMGG